MCLAIPGMIKSIDNQPEGRMASVIFGGLLKEVSLEMLPSAKVGDYVLVHVGVAISIIDEKEAKRTLNYLNETGEMNEF